MDRVRKDAFDKFYDEDDEDYMREEELKEAIDSEIENLDFEKDLFNRIINPVFRGEDVDEESLVKEFLSRIDLYLQY